MWKQLIAKIISSATYKKIKIWFGKSGMTNLVFLGISIGIWFIPLIPSGIKGHICTGALSIFVYINWNIIRKLWKSKVEDIKDKIDTF